jgi:hypothetical protein
MVKLQTSWIGLQEDCNNPRNNLRSSRMLIIKSLTIRGICSIPSVKLVISSVTYCFYHLRNLVYIFLYLLADCSCWTWRIASLSCTNSRCRCHPVSWTIYILVVFIVSSIYSTFNSVVFFSLILEVYFFQGILILKQGKFPLPMLCDHLTAHCLKLMSRNLLKSRWGGWLES